MWSARWRRSRSKLGRLRPPAEFLLQEARQCLAAGKLTDAKAKALAAQQLGVIFGLFDDNPEEVLAAIAEREAAAARTTPAPGFRNRALQMMQAARQDIAGGNLDAATAKALKVREMDLTFGALEDRPELILSDVDRARSASLLPVASTQAPASEPVAAPPAEAIPVGQPVAGTPSPQPLPIDVVMPAVGSFTGTEGDNITMLCAAGSGTILSAAGQCPWRGGSATWQATPVPAIPDGPPPRFASTGNGTS